MAKRKQRHGTSGNPARRAQATNSTTGLSPSRTPGRLQSYFLGAALVVVAVLVLFVPRPGGDRNPSGTAQDVAPPSAQTTWVAPGEVLTTGAPQQATDEAFCVEFVAMANSQGQFISDGESRPDLLEQSADDLIDVGVPANMSLPARTGYYRLISGVYDSIGLKLAPEAVGAVSTSVRGADAAFTAYLDQYCPA